MSVLQPATNARKSGPGRPKSKLSTFFEREDRIGPDGSKRKDDNSWCLACVNKLGRENMSPFISRKENWETHLQVRS